MESQENQNSGKWTRCFKSMVHLWVLLPIFALATGWLYFLTCLAPSLDNENEGALFFPKSIPELQELAQLLNLYYSTHPKYVIILFASAYVYKQAFTIPGSALLNLLGGALFGVMIGFPLCCALTGVGTTCCFLLSKYIGKDTIMAWFPNKLKYLKTKTEANRHRLFYYLLFLRMFPMSPNWLINILSPIIGIPYWLFVSTVVLGLMPYNYVCVQTGEMLASLSSVHSIYTPSTILKLTALALVALGPSFFFKGSSEEERHED